MEHVTKIVAPVSTPAYLLVVVQVPSATAADASRVLRNTCTLLAMLADGHLCKTELDALDCVDVHTQLGLPPAELHAIVHALCEDLLSSSLSGLREIGCKMTWPVHIYPLSIANGTTIGLKIVKICPRPSHFSLRLLKSDRLLARMEPGR